MSDGQDQMGVASRVTATIVVMAVRLLFGEDNVKPNTYDKVNENYKLKD